MKKEKVIIIAEAGVNHNGDKDIAMQLIDEASRTGADYIKFQTFKADQLATSAASTADYQKKNSGKNSQVKMLKQLELNEQTHIALIKHAKLRKIKFLSTPFDDESIVLLKKLKINIGKIPSGEITSLPYLRKMALSFRKIILSTGMSTLDEVKQALDVLYKCGKSADDITLLHCTTEYPAPYEDVNLNAMITLQKQFKLKVGYSDHTNGIEVPVAAVAMGAVVIEKHFTLSKKMHGPDHKASLEPAEFKNMVAAIRNIETAMGSFEKKPAKNEIKNRSVARKSIVAKRDINTGEILSEEMITIKRPGTGVSPMQWDKVIGSKAKKSFKRDELIVL
jgi:N,N'-diacetyllegionaminate synthase